MPSRSLPIGRIRCALLAACLGLGIPATDAGAAPASAPPAIRYDVASGSLDQALNAYARQSGVVLSADGNLTAGRHSDGLHGTYDIDGGFRALLAQHGLQAVPGTAAGTYVLRPAPPMPNNAATQLPTVSVTASADAMQNPGYVATQTVTATKTLTPLLETPQSVSVVTRAAMDNLGAQSVSQALRYSAGVLPDNAGAETRYDWINIRGVSESTLGLYLDGLRLQSNTEFRIEPYGLQQLDVLRGPSSVLYGQNAPGGLINMVTKRPTDDPLHEITLSYGSFNNRQASFDFSGPVDGNNKVLYRLTGLVRNSDTQVQYTPDDRTYIAPSVTLRPGDDTSLTLLASYQKDNVGFGQFLPAYGTVLDNPNGKIPVRRFVGDPDVDSIKREQTMFGYQLSHDFNSHLQFRQNFRYAHMSYRVNTAGYGLGYATVDKTDSDAAANYRYLNRLPFSDYRNVDVFGLDNQVEGRWTLGDFKHDVLAGLDYYDYNQLRTQGRGTNSVLDLYQPDYDGSAAITRIASQQRTHMRQTGTYVQDQITWRDHWIMTLGARRDWATQKVKNQLTSARTDQGDAANSFRGALMYRSDLGLAPYFSYSESFQPNIGSDRNGNQFDPSRGKQYEVGLKFQPRQAESFVTLSLFDLRMTNVLTTDPVDSTYSTAAGEQRSRGVELEGTAVLSDAWRVLGSYSYVDAKITKANDGTEGKHPTQQPAHMASLWLDYAIKGGPLRGLGAGAGVRYVGTTFIDADNTLGKTPPRTLVDLGVRYELDKHWRFALNANNLFDKIYAVCVTATQCAYGTRRTVMANATYRW
ncbi:TonB-dependent siderophore receptor [Achromobacter aloeverae]|uniref:TonB-dependent siderophore receptor n=1 Tax=Achromobacter aloeverae TaxID=1750518 RepID=A0A4Q1HJX8_9BURK|nr:TonB-dependent siderophore receptor [Achromobacter aloeverae]RXN90410.1 TonB-dependent siderophore receptor [Achromobacter aloeverae]